MKKESSVFNKLRDSSDELNKAFMHDALFIGVLYVVVRFAIRSEMRKK